MLNIIARKPRDGGKHGEYIVVDRGPRYSGQFVSATANKESLSQGEWFWGHYFNSREEAMDHFNNRSEEY